MRSFIVVNDRSRDGVPFLIEVRSGLAGKDLADAMRAAARDFLSRCTLERDNALNATGNRFDWGDLALWLPDGIAKAHGFEILDTHLVTAAAAVERDESLLPKQTPAGGGTNHRQE